jgi:hypothetical protein
MDAAGADLERLAERQRIGREQVRQVAIMTAVGAVAGVIVWVCFSGPIVRALPASWHVPEKMAAATLHLDTWAAGEQLMRTADPALWSDLVVGSKLERANHDKLEACRRAGSKTGRPQTCSIILETGT